MDPPPREGGGTLREKTDVENKSKSNGSDGSGVIDHLI